MIDNYYQTVRNRAGVGLTSSILMFILEFVHCLMRAVYGYPSLKIQQERATFK